LCAQRQAAGGQESSSEDEERRGTDDGADSGDVRPVVTAKTRSDAARHVEEYGRLTNKQVAVKMSETFCQDQAKNTFLNNNRALGTRLQISAWSSMGYGKSVIKVKVDQGAHLPGGAWSNTLMSALHFGNSVPPAVGYRRPEDIAEIWQRFTALIVSNSLSFVGECVVVMQ